MRDGESMQVNWFPGHMTKALRAMENDIKLVDAVCELVDVYNACEANKADALLGAKYKIDTEDYFVFKKVKCTATGYPGVINGVKVK